MPLQKAYTTHPIVNSFSTSKTLSIVIGIGRSVWLLMFPLTWEKNAKKIGVGVWVGLGVN